MSDMPEAIQDRVRFGWRWLCVRTNEYTVGRRVACGSGFDRPHDGCGWIQVLDPDSKEWNHLWEAETVAAQQTDCEPTCSVCGISEDDNAWGRMIDVTVLVSDGEEGYAEITQWLCADHFPPVQKALMALGFKDHRHGGIDFLEDQACPGEANMRICPTPTEYGPVTIRSIPVEPAGAQVGDVGPDPDTSTGIH